MPMFVYKIVGGFGGGMALFAGFSVWAVMMGIQEAWRAAHPTSKFAPTIQMSVHVTFISIAFVVGIGLHAGVWGVRRWLSRQTEVLGMSRTAWTVLLLTCYWLGFGGGAYVYFTMDL